VPRPQDAKPLRGGAGWSLRVGVYRILYDIDDAARRVTIYRVRHRRDAYR
jgi:mRNA interferase RelE/StbE